MPTLLEGVSSVWVTVYGWTQLSGAAAKLAVQEKLFEKTCQHGFPSSVVGRTASIPLTLPFGGKLVRVHPSVDDEGDIQGQTMRSSISNQQASPHRGERRLGRQDSPEWFKATCAQFQDATGWSLEFVPVESGGNHQETSCWTAEITNGQWRLGFLKLGLPDTPAKDSEFLAVTQLADLVAGLVNRVLQSNELLELRSRDIATLVRLSLSTPNEGSLLRTLQEILRACVQLTEFHGACFFLLDPKSNSLNIRGAYELDSTQVPYRKRDLSQIPPDLKVLTDGSVLLSRDQPDAAEWLPDGYSIGLGISVQSENVPLGTVWVFDRRRRTPNDRELQLLLSLGTHLAQILERVVLLRESATQHRLKRDLDQATEDDDDGIIEFDTPNGCDVVALCQSRYELGGDLCEIIKLNDSQTLIAVGDASGNSIPAAIVMTTVKGSLRALLPDIIRHRLTVEQAIERINIALHEITPAHRFMSFLCGILDTRKKTFQYSNAGHLAPLHVRNDQVQALNSHGLILGVHDGAKYGQSTLKLASHDQLIMFSDGIIEAQNHDNDLFGNEGVIRSIAGKNLGAAMDTLNAIWHGYSLHIAGAEEADDRTLCVVKID